MLSDDVGGDGFREWCHLGSILVHNLNFCINLRVYLLILGVVAVSHIIVDIKPARLGGE